ncbi:PD40 domain-containing protein [candidate division KSB1 bacterium]|nr:PD40 domain-containing protein [candidate division KSB1 bacterium]
MKKLFYSGLIILIVNLPAILIGEINKQDTKFLTQPAISKNHIAFVYAGDLWTADINGKNVRRITSDDGVESNPTFSPNGELLAFSAQYDGNTDVYIVPVEGGIPKRLTYHPGTDVVRGFTPDGSAVLFISPRKVFTRRHTQLFEVPINGGFPDALKIPNAFKATYSPDGKRMAYNPLSERFRQWKNYRGGTTSTIWLYAFKDHGIIKIHQPEGRCNDIDPMWIGDKIYFLSDRNGEFNLFDYNLNSKEINQLTHFADFPIIDASASENKIIFEQAGYLHVFDLVKGKSKKLTIGVATDLLELRSRYAKGSRHIRSASISPSGARAVFVFRGEVVTVPAEKGDARNLTNTTGAHERNAVWSPGGKSIAYFSDKPGEYQLHIKQQDGKGETKQFEIKGSGFYSNPVWSPDSKKLTFTDNGRNLYWINITSGSIKKIATEKIYEPGAFGSVKGVWSPDSKWIAYTLTTTSYIKAVYLYSIEGEKSYTVTDGLSDVSDPVFDESGKYIYFFASTDAGPVKHWFAMSNADMRMTRAIYLATLQKDVPSPLAKESDEEKGAENKEEKEEDEKTKKDEDKTEVPFLIDFENLNNRIISLPVDAGNLFSLQVGDEGKVYYLEAPATARGPFSKGTKLHEYDLDKRKDKVILSEANFYQISYDKKKILYRADKTWKIVPISGKSESEKGNLNINSIQVRIDPAKEWQQIFDEAWRINRDYFYATNMHGVDWKVMHKKYSVFLPHLSCRSDLNRLIQWMCSELSVGHHRVRGGDYYHNPEKIPGGLLGADYNIENGRYRFKKIYGGLNWNPELRSPLTEPGVNVKEGDYLLAVNGRELTSNTNLYSFFENTSGKIVEITIAPNPNTEDNRTVSVVPVANESALRNRDWVEGNIKKVDRASDGRVAYSITS